MKHPRFALNSEQTLHLTELRQVLTEALPPDETKEAKLPTVQCYCPECNFGCSAACMTSCRWSCYGPGF